jgi:hypothetical protein
MAKLLFSEICAAMPSVKDFGFKNSQLGGFFPGQEVPKTIFDCGGLRLPHNLRLNTLWRS